MAVGSVLCAFTALLCLTAAIGAKYNGPMSRGNVVFDRFSHHSHYVAKRQAPTNPPPVIDNHIYYTSKFYPPGPDADNVYFDLSQVNTQQIEVHNISDAFRVFATLDLNFDFPFYGHIINSIAITTAGFIYVGTYLHQFIHLTQYIAPLQADFNPGLNETATIIVYNANDRFTIQWDQVHHDTHIDAGPFTFQLSLLPDGTIQFAYREIPLPVSQIDNTDHPVEVGLADSFYIDRQIQGGFILRSIFEYHSVDLAAQQDNLAFSAFVITPLLNCIMASSCDQCVNVSRNTAFECGWCSSLQRCSDGIDRNRQEWFTSGCSDSSTDNCSPGLSAGAVAGVATASVVIFVLAAVVFGLCIGLLIYGYRNPQSKVGLYMIEHRPKARSLNKGTADTGAVYVADSS